ncbi:hypothetical protein [uncultured Cetobacterium sp.]|uniref:hypothetical protein n=1 Tax=uncultured Cetobacterium sp. TaxID=527638 RepID=UPI0026029305|nr:hypothetical protein [uncultured Cetobacterium sp.]
MINLIELEGKKWEELNQEEQDLLVSSIIEEPTRLGEITINFQCGLSILAEREDINNEMLVLIDNESVLYIKK